MQIEYGLLQTNFSLRFIAVYACLEELLKDSGELLVGLGFKLAISKYQHQAHGIRLIGLRA